MTLKFFKDIEWQLLPSGYHYHGPTDPTTGQPEGLGVLILINGLEVKGSSRREYAYYIGEFHHGKRDGHGYVLHYKEVEEQYWQRGTYEEVMATAEFDQCGRPIHYQNVGKWVKGLFWRWLIEQNGQWSADAFVSQEPTNFSKLEPWVNSYFFMTVQQLVDGEWKDVEYNWHNSQNIRFPLRDNFNYWTHKWPGYDNCAAINKYNREKLLVCNEYGAVFTLGYNEQFIWVRPDKPEERWVYRICLPE